MRILYISNNSSTGGAPAALLNLVRVMSLSHEVAVMMPDSEGPLFREMEKSGVRCYTSCPYGLSIWPRVLNPFKLVSRLIGLRRNHTVVNDYVGQVLEDFKPDIVHTNVGPLDIADLQCRKRGIPHVWHLREYQDLDFGMRYHPGGSEAFRAMISDENNHCISITEGVQAHWKPAGDSVVIYDGVAMPSYEAVDKREPYFLYAARIEKGKGLHNLLKAYGAYLRNGGKFRLMVAGRPCGAYAYMCRLYVKLHRLEDRVSFLGNRNDVNELMRSAAAFVVSSRFEGFGFTTVEAMYNRCIVIGNDTAGTKEQFDNGIRIKGREIGLRYRSVAELAALLGKIEKADGDFDRMREDAYDVVTSKYSVGRYASQVEAYYKRILEDRK